MPTGYDKTQMQDELLPLPPGRLMKLTVKMLPHLLRNGYPHHPHAETRQSYRRRSGNGRKKKPLRR